MEETMMDKAKRLVRSLIDRRLEKTDEPVEYDVYIVWFSKTLQNWKALVSTTLPNQQYFEVTYNGDLGETYVDTYVKVDNSKFIDEAYSAS